MKENLKLIPEVFFDFLAYLLPGSFLLTLFLSNENLAISQMLKNINNVKEALIIVFGGYYCGHILTTLSRFIIVKPLNYLFGNPLHTLIGIEDGLTSKFRAKLSDDMISKISSAIKEKFSSPIDKHTFFLCENFIRINYPDIGFLIRKRHAFEHLCRNLVLVFLILFFSLNSKEFDVLLVSIAVFSFIRYLDYRIS